MVNNKIRFIDMVSKRDVIAADVEMEIAFNKIHL